MDRWIFYSTLLNYTSYVYSDINYGRETQIKVINDLYHAWLPNSITVNLGYKGHTDRGQPDIKDTFPAPSVKISSRLLGTIGYKVQNSFGLYVFFYIRTLLYLEIVKIEQWHNWWGLLIRPGKKLCWNFMGDTRKGMKDENLETPTFFNLRCERTKHIYESSIECEYGARLFARK